ncbi:MalY/PatB family protein [Corynebacterium uterequi]|uniref:cysteine-S-conjugate beta-lyase n=1 Tax=Corynebacterium uterequi TaxID=1072256 RepID=A0A0G3HI53_9CORY|nr:aminotransferase class I/II-fold pyridoxal phosphate-dependent enzyme [Corynebacterium uterequi]AKK11598.1 aminotransferase [Corynebacterium uterequi]
MKFPSLEELKARGTRKWTVYPEDVLPLWIAESDFPTAPAVKAKIQQCVDNESFGYTPATSNLPTAMADFYERRYGWRPDPARIIPIPDVVRGMLLGIEYFTRPDSAVVVPTPIYPPFLALPETAGREKIEIEGRGGLDLSEVEEAFKAGAGSILIANPTNPLGYTFSRETLIALTDLASRYDARVIVDEIHAPLVLDGEHVVAAGVSETAARVCFSITALSKAWNVAGLKCAQLYLTNDDDVAVWESLTGVAKDGTGTLGVFAAEACYQDESGFLDEEIAYLRSTRDWLADAVEAAVPGLRATRGQATYLMWLDFTDTAIGDVDQPAAWLVEHAKVALNEGTDFGEAGRGHVRLNFATSREILAEAVRRIGDAVAAASNS